MSTDDTEPAPSPPAKKLTVQIDGFRAHRSGSLVGFVDIIIIELTLRIRDATVHQKNASRWISMPARPQLDRETATSAATSAVKQTIPQSSKSRARRCATPSAHAPSRRYWSVSN